MPGRHGRHKSPKNKQSVRGPGLEVVNALADALAAVPEEKRQALREAVQAWTARYPVSRDSMPSVAQKLIAVMESE